MGSGARRRFPFPPQLSLPCRRSPRSDPVAAARSSQAGHRMNKTGEPRRRMGESGTLRRGSEDDPLTEAQRQLRHPGADVCLQPEKRPNLFSLQASFTVWAGLGFLCILCGLHHPLCLIGDDSSCHQWFTASEQLQMPKDQGEACSLLSFCESSHGWPDHLVVSTSLPCPGAMSASLYRLNRLHTLSLEPGAALRISELCKGTGNVLLAAATTT